MKFSKMSFAFIFTVLCVHAAAADCIPQQQCLRITKKCGAIVDTVVNNGYVNYSKDFQYQIQTNMACVTASGQVVNVPQIQNYTSVKQWGRGFADAYTADSEATVACDNYYEAFVGQSSIPMCDN